MQIDEVDIHTIRALREITSHPHGEPSLDDRKFCKAMLQRCETRGGLTIFEFEELILRVHVWTGFDYRWKTIAAACGCAPQERFFKPLPGEDGTGSVDIFTAADLAEFFSLLRDVGADVDPAPWIDLARKTIATKSYLTRNELYALWGERADRKFVTNFPAVEVDYTKITLGDRCYTWLAGNGTASLTIETVTEKDGDDE